MNYIDKYSKEKLKNFQITPETNWKSFKENHAGKLTPDEYPKLNTKDYFTVKNILISVAGISLLTVGILFSTNNNDEGKSGIKFIRKNTLIEKPEALPEPLYKDTDKISSNTESNPKNNPTKTLETEDVIIKVEVPIIKNIEVRKEILIKDTINN